MALYEIKKYGDSVLKKKASAVTEFNAELKKIFDNMLETMYANKGVGLAGNQVGILKRVIVLNTDPDSSAEIYMLANPEIIKSSREKSKFEEGCLSFPGITETIERPAEVTVRAFTPEGKRITIDAKALKATALQHEIDHLNGIVFIDRMSPVKRFLHKKELREIKKSFAKIKK